MTAEYDQRGFCFRYPENWELVATETTGWPRSVAVHAPNGGFWSVTADSWPSYDLLERMVQAMSQEYETCEREPVSRQVGPFLLHGVELNFYCLDMLVTAHVLEVPQASQPTVLLLQAENRDFDAMQQVFDAISYSLLQAMPDDEEADGPPPDATES